MINTCIRSSCKEKESKTKLNSQLRNNNFEWTSNQKKGFRTSNLIAPPLLSSLIPHCMVPNVFFKSKYFGLMFSVLLFSYIVNYVNYNWVIIYNFCFWRKTVVFKLYAFLIHFIFCMQRCKWAATFYRTYRIYNMKTLNLRNWNNAMYLWSLIG